MAAAKIAARPRGFIRASPGQPPRSHEARWTDGDTAQAAAGKAARVEAAINFDRQRSAFMGGVAHYEHKPPEKLARVSPGDTKRASCRGEPRQKRWPGRGGGDGKGANQKSVLSGRAQTEAMAGRAPRVNNDDEKIFLSGTGRQKRWSGGHLD
eukprot:scaffold5343_cov48-Phaeocystis_antarctica.AAC.4